MQLGLCRPRAHKKLFNDGRRIRPKSKVDNQLVLSRPNANKQRDYKNRVSGVAERISKVWAVYGED